MMKDWSDKDAIRRDLEKVRPPERPPSMFSLYKKIKKNVRRAEKLMADLVIEYGVEPLMCNPEFEELRVKLQKDRKRIEFLAFEMANKKSGSVTGTQRAAIKKQEDE